MRSFPFIKASSQQDFKMCDRCGCSKAFDGYGDRLCWCDACWTCGCRHTHNEEVAMFPSSEFDHEDVALFASTDTDNEDIAVVPSSNAIFFEACPLIVRFYPYVPTLASLCRIVRTRLTLNKERVLAELFDAQESMALQQAFVGTCASRDPPTVARLIQKFKSLARCCVTMQKTSPILHEVLYDFGDGGPEELVEKQIGERSEWIKMTPMASAVKANDVTTMQLLLDARAAIHGIVRERIIVSRCWSDEVGSRERHIDTALRLALRNKAVGAAELILQKKVDLNRRQKVFEGSDSDTQASEHATPLSLVIVACARDMVQFLLDKGASVEGMQSLHNDVDMDQGVEYEENQTVFMQALLAGELSIARDLLRHGVTANGEHRRLQKKNFELHEAEFADNCTHIAHYLDTETFVQSPLAACLESTHINAVILLLQAKVCTNGSQYRSHSGREYASPLLIAMTGVAFMANAAGCLPRIDDKMPEMELTSQRLVKLLLKHRAAVNGIQGRFGGKKYEPLTAALRVRRCYREPLSSKNQSRTVTVFASTTKREKSVVIWSLLREAGAVDGFTQHGEDQEGIVVHHVDVDVQEIRVGKRQKKHARRALLRAGSRLDETVREAGWETDDSLE